MQARGGGSAFSRFPRGGSEISSRVLLSHDLGHYSLPDRNVSIKHVSHQAGVGVQEEGNSIRVQ